MKVLAEYLWIDGHKPTADIRSKTKILDSEIRELADLPVWGFDGSSTEQADGHTSDCVLQPVAFWPDPIRGAPHVIVLNEVELPDGRMHPSNSRARLRELAGVLAGEGFWFGLEQEYTLFKGKTPLGFMEGMPEPQGKYYCGVGAGKIVGRELVEEHLTACLQAGILMAGINAEVMPGQWEFQIGTGGPLEVADNMIVARWLLHRLGEKQGITVSLEPKPALGDWNGAGCHTNFSTRAMREDSSIFPAIISKMEMLHKEHIAVYGAGIEKRLTGKHETCDVNTFRSGVSDRGASVRIPWQVHKLGKGYLEDRRPCANIDPYVVLSRIMETVGKTAVMEVEARC